MANNNTLSNVALFAVTFLVSPVFLGAGVALLLVSGGTATSVIVGVAMTALGIYLESGGIGSIAANYHSKKFKPLPLLLGPAGLPFVIFKNCKKSHSSMTAIPPTLPVVVLPSLIDPLPARQA
jgi:hypothetical protein